MRNSATDLKQQFPAVGYTPNCHRHANALSRIKQENVVGTYACRRRQKLFKPLCES
jgi:hypothetical protein